MKKWKRWTACTVVTAAVGAGIVLCGIQHTTATGEKKAETVYAATGGAVNAETSAITLEWGKKKTCIKAGKSMRLQVLEDGEPVQADEIIWQVSDTKKASINQKGVLQAKQYGTVSVRATGKGETLTCKVKIKPKQVIGLDPGHQSRADGGLEPVGPGASTKKPKVAGGTCGVSTHVPEYKLTLSIGKKLKKELVSRGYRVVMTRTKNEVTISNKERAQKINNSGADICVRIHGDGGASSARGASGLYPSERNPYVGKLSSKSYKLSSCIMNAYCKKTGITNRGNIQRDDLSGTNWSKVPVMLIELGFMTNATEDRYMQSADGQKKMVQGIADGIDAYYK